MKKILLISLLLIASVASAQDAWLDTGVGAVSPYGNILGIQRLTENVNYAFAWDNSSASMVVILLDNEGNLNAQNPFNCPYLMLDVYSNRIDVYCAWPGTAWHLEGRVSR